MVKPKRLLLVIVVILFAAAILVLLTTQAQAVHIQMMDNPQNRRDIEETIKTYFETRYHSFKTLQLGDFGGLVDKSPRGNSFLSSESDKLEVEINHAKLYHLG